MVTEIFPVFFNKSDKTLPFMMKSYPKLQKMILPDESMSISAARDPFIAAWSMNNLEEGPLKFDSTTCTDLVIFATGYSQSLPFLDPSYPLPEHAKVRGIWKKDEPTVGFIGFVRPSFGKWVSISVRINLNWFVIGAIPPISEMQVQLWILNLLNRLPAPLQQFQPSPDQFQETYVYQLALDMHSAPSISDIAQMHSWKLALCWALSANVNTKFRLVGPWKWGGAKKVMETEIWDTVMRRPLILGTYPVLGRKK